MLRAALLSLSLLPACASSPPPALASAPATLTIARATPARPGPSRSVTGPDALVWTTDDAGALHTRWLTPSLAGYRQIAEAPELILTAGPDAWRWSAHEETVPTVPCTGEVMNQPAGEGHVTRAALERLGSSERAEVVASVTDAQANEIHQTVTPVGSFGPYLFVREQAYEYACGAHGASYTELTVWDLTTRTKVDVLSAAEHSDLDEAERREALRLLAAESGGDTKLEDVTYKTTLPHYSARGGLHLEHVFTTWACYACGGEWGSYTQAAKVPVQRLPERARAYAHAPDVVDAYLEQHHDETIAGWSEVSPEAARVLGRTMTGG